MCHCAAEPPSVVYSGVTLLAVGSLGRRVDSGESGVHCAGSACIMRAEQGVAAAAELW